MKKVILFKSGHNFGAEFRDGNRKTTWDALTDEEQRDLTKAMLQMGEFFSRFVKDED